MRNNSAGIRGTRARGRKQSKRSHGYSDLSAATSGNGSVDKLRGTTISRLKGRPQRGKREVQTFLSSHNPIRNHSVDRENNCVTHDYACRCSCNSPPVLGKSSITMYIDDDNVDQRAYSWFSFVRKEYVQASRITVFRSSKYEIKKILDQCNFEDSSFFESACSFISIEFLISVLSRNFLIVYHLFHWPYLNSRRVTGAIPLNNVEGGKCVSRSSYPIYNPWKAIVSRQSIEISGRNKKKLR